MENTNTFAVFKVFSLCIFTVTSILYYRKRTTSVDIVGTTDTVIMGISYNNGSYSHNIPSGLQ